MVCSTSSASRRLDSHPGADRDGRWAAAHGEIAFASGRLDALILGYADLVASLGRRGDPGSGGWLHAQETVLVAARAAGLQAIDGPIWQYGIRKGCGGASIMCACSDLMASGRCIPTRLRSSARLSLRGPTSLRARRVIAALEGAEGIGSVELEGEMIDEASRKLAAQVVVRGRAAGLSSAPGEAAG